MLTGAIGIFSEALRPVIGPIYVLYGLLPLWFALVGRTLLRLGRGAPAMTRIWGARHRSPHR